MTERRYSDEEVSEIFAKAAEGQERVRAPLTRNEGMTLAQLQDIGQQAGISADAIAGAAQSLAVRAPPPARLLGMPVSVERSIALDRRLTDAEWEQLVVQLRTVFNASGVMGGQGGFREWRNGNLQALLEPTPTGQQLRLRTTNSTAQLGVVISTVMLSMSGIVAISSAVAHHLARGLPGVAFTGIIGIGALLYGLLPLRGWAQRRAQQMEDITSSIAP